ncbi:MAG TPA: DUF4337 domain-containing protein [Chthoniobacteraceae bacterium]|nr:DUF4337 domain-containing protein [Chthoniobacteraceae bacterium]
MESPEVPMEKVHEHIEEHAHEAKEKWITMVALSTAVLAVLAAVTSLLAGNHSDEAMSRQIESSDQWSYYQAKGIKAGLVETRIQILTAMGHPPADADTQQLQKYKSEQEEIQKEAETLQQESKMHSVKHDTLARGVTMFQIAIAVGAISVMTRRKMFWGVSLLFGAAGVWFLACGF